MTSLHKKLVWLIGGALLTTSPVWPESVGVTITQAGQYFYGGDLYLSPTDVNDAIITVSANDVIVDLGNHLFSQDPSNTVTGFTAIRIMPNVQRCTVRNGRIENITGYAIEVCDGVSGCIFKNLEIIRCQKGGVIFNGLQTGTGISAIEFYNSIIASCAGASGSPAYGVKASYVQQMLLKNIEIIKSDAVISADGFGCYIESSTGISFKENTVSANGGYGRGVGASLNNCLAILIRDSVFNVNVSRSSAGTAYSAGLELINCDDCQIANCNFDKNYNPFACAYGLRCIACSDILISNISSQANTGGVIGCGINFNACNRCSLFKSSTYANVGATAYGFCLDNVSTYCYLYDNHIANNQGMVSYGIVDDANPSTNLVINNKAFNHTTNYAISYVSGINLPVLDGSLTNTAIGLSGHGPTMGNISVYE